MRILALILLIVFIYYFVRVFFAVKTAKKQFRDHMDSRFRDAGARPGPEGPDPADFRRPRGGEKDITERVRVIEPDD